MDKRKITADLKKESWEEFVFRHPLGNIFQTPEIFEVYKNTKNYEPLLRAIIDENGSIIAVLLAVVQKDLGGMFGNFTARAVISGGPLTRSGGNENEAVRILLEALSKDIGKKVVYLQFRNLFDCSAFKAEFDAVGYRMEEHLNFIINLNQDEERLWDELYSAKRRAIKKAINEKLEVKILSQPHQIKESFDILKSFYRKIRIPLPDKSYFDSIFQILYPKNMAKAFGVYYLDKMIGALYVFLYKNTITVGYTASLLKHRSKRPNDILYWEAIKWGSRNGYKIFDFGGAGAPDRKYGVRDFKKQFGGATVNYGRFFKTYKPVYAALINAGLKFLSRFR